MSRKALLLFLALGVIWGVPYLLIRIAVADYHPLIVAFGRAAIGALVLLPFAIRGGGIMAGFRKPGWLILFTLAEISGPWFLIGFAETRVTSSLAGLIIALTPILAAILGVVLSQERLGTGRLIGLGLGLAGVVALLGFDEQPTELLPVLALGASAFGYALGPIIVARRLADTDDGAVVVASLIVASVLYLPFVPAYWPARFPLDASLAVLALAIICTALAFQLLFALIAEVGASRATVIAYLNPAVAVLLGVSILGEPFSFALLLGFALIVAGSYFSTARKPLDGEPAETRAAAE
ncbi:DMT family transporter [Bosea eneae]|uniref:DMT family transporter n=1 Tax=Bosea eneae TaxID=151454 RepID=A0ABW0IS03_9HYPH